MAMTSTQRNSASGGATANAADALQQSAPGVTLRPRLIRLNDILQRVAGYHPDPDLDIIKKAYVYSAKVHQGQVRKSGEPYLIHPLEVAGILAQLRLDEASIVAGLLHDTVEDTLATIEEIKELFGDEVALIVDGVTKLGKFSASQQLSQEEKQAENFRKMLVAMAQDIRVILVKLADRTHNMRTLDHMSEEKQARIAQETLDIYAPLANRLGISWMKTELEDLSFRYTRPKDYLDLENKVARKKKEREKYIDDVVGIIEAKLKESGRAREGERALQALLFHLQEDALAGHRLRAGARRDRLPGDHARAGAVLRRAGPGAPDVEAGAGALQGLHRDPQAEHVPVAAHHGDRPARPSASRSRSAPRRCTGSPRKASPRTGPTRKAAAR